MDLEALLEKHPRIAADAAIMVGKPCIKGTRLTVELILHKLAGGWSVSDLLDAYPVLSEADIRSAEDFAADLAGAQRAVPAE